MFFFSVFFSKRATNLKKFLLFHTCNIQGSIQGCVEDNQKLLRDQVEKLLKYQLHQDIASFCNHSYNSSYTRPLFLSLL